MPILIDEHYSKITKNLHAALLRLRNHSFERIVWVDAICIDQADDQEKARQIQNMAKIYGRDYLARSGDRRYNQTFENIRSAAEDEVTDASEEANQEAILKLLERRRIWVREPISIQQSLRQSTGKPI